MGGCSGWPQRSHELGSGPAPPALAFLSLSSDSWSTQQVPRAVPRVAGYRDDREGTDLTRGIARLPTKHPALTWQGRQ